MSDRKLIVSLTSYPARMGTLNKVLDSIYAQTRQADEIVLWLAEEQFPGKEQDLPRELLELVGEDRLTVRWCDDLKPHKKYFYALQEYRRDLVVTIDDDLLYPEHMLENLYQCYLRHPKAVSAVRAHLMVVSEGGDIMPYSSWVKETDVCQDQPSMQLFATGGAGALYPPELFPPETFNKAAILENCLWADDLWLKAVQLIADIPVVVAQPFEDLRYVPGTQMEGLYHQNEDGNQNDVQLGKISAWMDGNVGKGVLVKKLTETDIGVRLLGVDALCAHVGAERAKHRQKMRAVNAKLQQTYAEKSEINAKLKRTYAEKSELNAKLRKQKLDLHGKLKKVYAEKSALNARLQQTFIEKSTLNAKLQKTYDEKAERGKRIKELERELAEERYSHTIRGRCERVVRFLKHPFQGK